MDISRYYDGCSVQSLQLSGRIISKAACMISPESLKGFLRHYMFQTNLSDLVLANIVHKAFKWLSSPKFSDSDFLGQTTYKIT